MTTIEQTGKDIEEATQLALEELGVTEDEVHVEILDEGARGFFGLGQTPARVRVTIKEPGKPGRKAEPSAAEPAAAPSARAPKAEEPVPESAAAKIVEPAPSAEVLRSAADMSLELLQRILDGIDVGTKASVESASDGQVVLNVSADNPAILIGKHGQTVNAIQYLVGVMTNKRIHAKVRVIVDVEGYRGRREKALTEQAHYLARKVKESGEEAVLEALQPNERRIIHLALADDPDIHTYSEGEEPARHVVISPKK